MAEISRDYKYLDFHTHSRRQLGLEHVVEVVSVHLGQQKEFEYFTIGMHPWWTDTPITTDQQTTLSDLLSNPKCLAMGEMGLDNLKGPGLSVQMDVLRSQLQIAQAFKKPVIIHCVRAFDQLIQIKKEFPAIDKWCVHGYGRHSILARQLIDQGFYLSLMPTMPLAKYKELFDALPHDRLFLETDSMPHVDILEIYVDVAAHLSMEVSDLCNLINNNAKGFFSNE